MERMVIIIGLILAGIVSANFVMQVLVDDSAGWRRQMSEENIEAQLMKHQDAAIYETVAAGFPQDYAQHLGDLNKIVADRSVPMELMGQKIAEEGQRFFDDLQETKTFYTAQAQAEALRAVQSKMVAVLNAAREDAALCGSLAAHGVENLTQAQRSKLPITLLTDLRRARLEAIVSGRDRPMPHGAPDSDDWAAFLNGFPDDAATRSVVRQFLDGDLSDPRAFCDGAIAFNQQLLADESAGTLRILAEIGARVGTP